MKRDRGGVILLEIMVAFVLTSAVLLPLLLSLERSVAQRREAAWRWHLRSRLLEVKYALDVRTTASGVSLRFQHETVSLARGATLQLPSVRVYLASKGTVALLHVVARHEFEGRRWIEESLTIPLVQPWR